MNAVVFVVVVVIVMKLFLCNPCTVYAFIFLLSI
jgi:hypothetical protein